MILTTRNFLKKIGVQMQDGSFEEYVKLDELIKIFCDLYCLPSSVGDNYLNEFDLLHIKKSYLTKLSGG